MRCSICGGNIRYNNGLYVCESCGAKQTISDFFGKVEVFICYKENDEFGRRTRDSIIAEDLYKRIESKKITTFYQRISAEYISENDLEQICTDAANCAKIIIIVATNAEYFEFLLKNIGNLLSSKKVIPVYSDMNVFDLPKELVSLQAMNYNNIGSATELTKVILSNLGRGYEIDIINAEAERKRTINNRKIVATALVSFLGVVSAVYFVFGSPYILRSRRYNYAEKMLADGRYTQSVDMFSNLGDYKNSHNELQSIYAKYDGYYINQENTLCLYLNITNNQSKIKLTKVSEKGNITFEAYNIIDKSMLKFDFKDSSDNLGNGIVELLDNGVHIITKMDTQNDFMFGDTDMILTFEDKSDAPMPVTVGKDEIVDWLKNKTTAYELKKQGYDLSIMDIPSGYPNWLQSQMFYKYYNIQDTNINVMISGEMNEMEKNIIYGVFAPAKVVASDKIGELKKPFLRDDVLYVPDGIFYEAHRNIGYEGFFKFAGGDNNTSENITENTMIGIVSKEIGEEYWETILKYQLIDPIIYDEATRRYGGDYHSARANLYIENETDDDFVVSFYLEERKLAVFCRVNKTNSTFEFITEVSHYEENAFESQSRSYGLQNKNAISEFAE